VSDVFSFLNWYIAATLAGGVALPLAFRLFHLLPDRGYTLARPLGLLATGYGFWLLGTLGFLRNDAGGVLIAAALVLIGGLAWLARAGVGELWLWLRANAGVVLRVEIVFLLAFAAWAYVRAYNPEIVATEKPMDFMFVNAILRSPTFPPSDAWLSGHTISYYYFGYLLVAALTKVTGVSSAVAFNLALALFFALTATGALGVVMNLIALTKAESLRSRGGMKDEVLSLHPSAFWPALLAPLMIVVAGNWYGVLRLAHANGVARDAQVPAVYYSFGAAATGEPPGLRAGLVNVWTWLDLKGANDPSVQAPAEWTWDPGYWWWFSGARVTHDKNLVGQETEAITEMPAFSFILGDLHPHVMALPFVFLPIALALQWMVWAASGRGAGVQGAGENATREGLNYQLLITSLPRVPIILSALLLGALAFLNTWDFPIYWFVVVMAFAVGLGLAWGWDELLRRWMVVAVFAAALALLGVLLYLPFFLTFQSQAGGFLPNLIYPTRFQQTVVMFAHVLVAVALFVGWLAVREWERVDKRAALWAGGGIVGVLILVLVAMMVAASLNPELASFAAGFIAPLTFDGALALTLQRRLIDSATTLVPALLIGLAVGFGVAALKHNQQSAISNQQFLITNSPSVLMSLIFVATGALLLLGPEFIYLRDNFGTRMNTIFKFYFQVWVLWGLAGAFGVWVVAQRARPVVSGVVLGVVGLAIAASLVYTWAATYSKTNHFAGPPTLDGMAYFAQQYPDDWAAINWLNANVREPAVIAEGIGGQYWIEGRFSRISMATGLPTVMGWPGHEAQWRGNYFNKVAEREGAIQQLYQTRDAAGALATMQTYSIEYLILSDLERGKYGNLNPARFESFMRPVFQSGSLTIYQRAEGGQ
jgi:YYY domain-containing protein